MEVLSEGEIRTDEPAALDIPIYLRMPHRHMSRVFTIKHRTYRVCCDCGREFELPGTKSDRFDRRRGERTAALFPVSI